MGVGIGRGWGGRVGEGRWGDRDGEGKEERRKGRTGRGTVRRERGDGEMGRWGDREMGRWERGRGERAGDMGEGSGERERGGEE